MRRYLLLVVPAVLATLGAGCKSSCGERTPLLGRKHDDQAHVAKGTTPMISCDSCLMANQKPVDGAYMPSNGFNYPAYPSGPPSLITPGAPAPGNELPYPTIPAPGLPAQPIPAIPDNGQTASGPKLPK